MSGKKRMLHHPLETKLEAIRLFSEEGKTVPKSRRSWAFEMPTE